MHFIIEKYFHGLENCFIFSKVNKKKKCKRVKFDGWSDTTDDSDCLNLKVSTFINLNKYSYYAFGMC